jgi:hypothetical protein
MVANSVIIVIVITVTSMSCWTELYSDIHSTPPPTCYDDPPLIYFWPQVNNLPWEYINRKQRRKQAIPGVSLRMQANSPAGDQRLKGLFAILGASCDPSFHQVLSASVFAQPCPQATSLQSLTVEPPWMLRFFVVILSWWILDHISQFPSLAVVPVSLGNSGN